MYVKEKLVEMLLLQDETNRKVFPDWRYRLTATDFRVAFLVEAGELADHLGYKWWSQKEPDLDQARMEAVDMWHFLMSEWMLSGSKLDSLLTVTQALPISTIVIQRTLARSCVSMLLTQGGDLMAVMSRFGLLVPISGSPSTGSTNTTSAKPHSTDSVGRIVMVQATRKSGTDGRTTSI